MYAHIHMCMYVWIYLSVYLYTHVCTCCFEHTHLTRPGLLCSTTGCNKGLGKEKKGEALPFGCQTPPSKVLKIGTSLHGRVREGQATQSPRRNTKETHQPALRGLPPSPLTPSVPRCSGLLVILVLHDLGFC